MNSGVKEILNICSKIIKEHEIRLRNSEIEESERECRVLLVKAEQFGDEKIIKMVKTMTECAKNTNETIRKGIK